MSDKVKRNLANLLSGAKEAEKEITGKKDEERPESVNKITEDSPKRTQEASKTTVESVATVVTKEPGNRVGESHAPEGYAGMFVSNPAFKSYKRESAFLYTPVRDALKNLANAEDSEMITLLNNICLAFIKENKDDVKKSLKKLERSVNELI